MPPDESSAPSPPTPPVTPPSKQDRPRFQFSLKTLLIGVTVLMVVLGMSNFFRLGPMEMVWAAIFCAAIPSAVLIVAIFARGEPQIFAIGAIAVLIVWLINISSRFSFYSGLLPVGMAVVGGIFAVWTRRWIRRWGWDQPK